MARISKRVQESRRQDALASAHHSADQIGLAMTVFVRDGELEHKDASNPKCHGSSAWYTALPARYHRSNELAAGAA